MELTYKAYLLHKVWLPHINRLSKIDFQCADKMSGQNNLRMKICRKGHKPQKKCIKISKIRIKEVIFFYSFAFKIQNFAQVVNNFASSCLPLLETLDRCPYWLKLNLCLYSGVDKYSALKVLKYISSGQLKNMHKWMKLDTIWNLDLKWNKCFITLTFFFVY